MIVWLNSSTVSPASGLVDTLGRLSKRAETTGMQELARQRMPDDAFRQTPDLDQRIDVDAGVDAHLLAQEHKLFGAYIAGRALVCREGAAAEAADGGIEAAHAHLKSCISV